MVVNGVAAIRVRQRLLEVFERCFPYACKFDNNGFPLGAAEEDK
jgi:hypothetical protein